MHYAVLGRELSSAYIMRSNMPSERVQRQIDTLLDQAEESTANREWDSVLESVAGVLALDGKNEDALAFRAMAEQARDAGSSEVVIPDSSPVVANPASYNRPSEDDSPTSFARGRYWFCQDSASGQNSIIPQLLRRSDHVLPALPICVHFE